jgi:hypothetical protein
MLAAPSTAGFGVETRGGRTRSFCFWLWLGVFQDRFGNDGIGIEIWQHRENQGQKNSSSSGAVSCSGL